MRQRLASLLPSGDALEVPGSINMWLFVLGEFFIFAFYFFVFMNYRTHETDLFVESQRHLNLVVGTLNTVILLTSSYLVALAVQAAREGALPRARRLVVGTFGLGVVFIAIKVGEWVYEIHHGYTFQRDDFFMFYFGLTGVHLFHVLIGLGVLGFLFRELRVPSMQRLFVVEAGATYWHMVDVIWIILFALLYVLR